MAVTKNCQMNMLYHAAHTHTHTHTHTNSSETPTNKIYGLILKLLFSIFFIFLCLVELASWYGPCK